MARFDFDSIEPAITAEYILERYTEEQLYKFYYKDFQLGDTKSPFRDDAHPSFRFFETDRSKDYRIFWKDLATNEGGHVFKFIEKHYKQFLGFKGKLYELYVKVNTDLLVGDITPIEPEQQEKVKKKRLGEKKRSEVKIQVVQTKEKDIPEAFIPIWESLGINLSILKMYYVGFAVQVWIKKWIKGSLTSISWGTSTNTDPIFFYLFPGTGHVKCYRPLHPDRKGKWINNATNDKDVQGLEQCHLEERGMIELLVITKSMKDVMWLRSIGVDAIAFHGEGNTVSAEFMAYLRKHCKLIISVYDNDRAGKHGAWKLRKEHNVPAYFIPNYYKAKDITDLYKLDYRTLFFLIDILNDKLKHDYNGYTGIGYAAVS